MGDVPIDPEVLTVLGPGEFLNRIYQDPKLGGLDLFLAYFPSQRSGDTIHSPQNCLPGAGWVPVENRIVSISVPDHKAFRANRYIVAKGDERDIVLYWYWSHDRGVASEYVSRYYLVADSMRLHRSDGALVRLAAHMAPDETADQAEQRLMPFALRLVPLLDEYIPR